MARRHDLVAFLQSSVNWDRFFSVVEAIGDTLNGTKDRFDKSDILELALEVYSNGRIKWANEEGRDHWIPKLSTYCEMKYDEKSLFTLHTKKPQKMVTLTLVNKIGSGSALPGPYANFVLVVGRNGCAVASKRTINRHLTRKGDQLKARIPFSGLSVVRYPEDISPFKVKIPFSYKREKLRLQKEFLARCQKR